MFNKKQKPQETKKEVKFKGKKFYAVVTERATDLFYPSNDIEYSKRGLDSVSPFLVELTVTRVFIRERDLKEIEVDEVK